jgi:hypothetical protein
VMSGMAEILKATQAVWSALPQQGRRSRRRHDCAAHY